MDKEQRKKRERHWHGWKRLEFAVYKKGEQNYTTAEFFYMILYAGYWL